MDDFTYDIVCKKRIANGARHMKRGSKSRKCGLPSDSLTAKQLKERNGPVMSYALNLPMSWGVFKTMPLDLQQTYLDSLHSRFNAGAATISRDLFDMSEATLSVHARRKGLKTAKGAPLTGEAREVWENWLNTADPEKITLDPLEEITPIEENPTDEGREEPAPAEEEPVKFSPGGIGGPGLHEFLRGFGAPTREPTEPLGLHHLSATFTGEFSAERFLQWITKLPMPDGDVRICVEVTAR